MFRSWSTQYRSRGSWRPYLSFTSTLEGTHELFRGMRHVNWLPRYDLHNLLFKIWVFIIQPRRTCWKESSSRLCINLKIRWGAQNKNAKTPLSYTIARLSGTNSRKREESLEKRQFIFLFRHSFVVVVVCCTLREIDCRCVRRTASIPPESGERRTRLRCAVKRLRQK